MREIFGSFSLHTNQWTLPLFNEKEFKSFHILDGIFIIYSFRPDWDIPFTVIHAPSDDIGRLWAERKKKSLLSIVRHQSVCQERKAWHARNPTSGKPTKNCLPIHPCCSEETALLFTKVPSFCSYKFFKCILGQGAGRDGVGGECNNQMSHLIPDSWSGDKGGNQGQVWFCSKIKIQVLQNGVRIRKEVQKH